MEQVGEEDVEEMEAREVREVPLRRANKSVSLAAGLNRLQAGEGEGEDLPDAEGREGRTSFLHSKCKIISGHNVSSDHLYNKTYSSGNCRCRPFPVQLQLVRDGGEEKTPTEEEIQQDLPGYRGVHQYGRCHQLRGQKTIKVRKVHVKAPRVTWVENELADTE